MYSPSIRNSFSEFHSGIIVVKTYRNLAVPNMPQWWYGPTFLVQVWLVLNSLDLSN